MAVKIRMLLQSPHNLMSINPAKLSRIYLSGTLEKPDDLLSLDKDQSHYLLTVMRKSNGDKIRVFNGVNGEWLCEIIVTGKKAASLRLIDQLRPQINPAKTVHLYFAPIKKDRLSTLIEKSVELGVTHFHPVITAHTENRHLNSEKIAKQIIEASEQCERLDIPQWHDSIAFESIVTTDYPVFAAIERHQSPAFTPPPDMTVVGCFIGPEGGWSEDEKQKLLSLKFIHPVTLGTLILRAETAALVMLARLL